MIEGPYWMRAQWGGRPETPSALADRFLRTVDALTPLHPFFHAWEWGDKQEIWDTEGEGGSHPFDEIRCEMTHAIERNVSVTEGHVDPASGYLMMIIANEAQKQKLTHLTVKGGAIPDLYCTSPFVNYATFHNSPRPDPSLLTFPLWRSIMLVLAETWEATWAEALPADLASNWSSVPARLAWMNYVSPRFAPLITPPASAIVEHRPNGGLFLAATDELFTTANAKHMAVARDIVAALQPMNQLPSPINDAYR